MNKTVLCIDIDDCLIPASSTYFGRFDDTLDIMAANMRRIKAMIEMFDMEVFITSSWYSSLMINEDKTLSFKRGHLHDVNNKPNHIFQAFKLLHYGVGARVTGLSCGDRYKDIGILLNEGYKVIAVDDMCLHSTKIIKQYPTVDANAIKSNYLFLHVRGFITNEHSYMVHKFMGGD